MRTKQNTLLAGVAALALFAGTGMALAQQGPQGQNGAPDTKGQAGVQAGPTQPGTGMQQHAQTGAQTGAKIGGPAALNTKGPQVKHPSMAEQGAAKGANRSAQIKRNKIGPAGANKTAQNRQEHLGATAQTKGKAPERLGADTKFERNRSTAQNEHGRRGSMHAAQRNERNGKLKGLQGNASLPMQGSHVSLTPEQRTRIRDTVIDARGAPRVGHVNFNVRVGTLIPRRQVHVIPVPETLVRLDAGWRGFLYFIVRDEVVIVNPRDMRIVAVLPA